MKRSDGVVQLIQQWIENGTLTPGAKAPSVRQMSRITGYSMSTVHSAYGQLESAGVIVAQPRSGFYIDKVQAPVVRTTPTQDHAAFEAAHEISISDLSMKLFSSWSSSEIQQFGAIYPSPDLFPVDDINLHFRRILRRSPSWGFTRSSNLAQGDPSLRAAISRRYVEHGLTINPADIVLTSGGMHGVNLTLNVLTKPGDIVIIESPGMFPVFTSLEHRGLRAIEIPQVPGKGLDPAQFRYLLERHNVKACVLMANHHYPTGATTPEDSLKAMVQCARQYEVPIIENAGYMDLHYDAQCPPSFKKFDDTGLVYQIGSFSNMLAPGYGAGWLVPGRLREKIIQMKFTGNLLSGGIFQRAVADYINCGSFDRHLRALRTKMKSRMDHGLKMIEKYFPEDCSVTPPAGGFMCWIEGPQNLDAMAASREALALGIGMPAGPLFSVRESLTNCIGLNFSFPWDEKSEARIKTIGELIRKHS